MTVEYGKKTQAEKDSKADWGHKRSRFARQAIKFFPKTGKLLEIGTGQGGDADYFQSLGYEVTATDYSDEALRNAEERVKNVNFINLDTSQGLPFDNESFDVVYSHMALHYFDSQTTARVFKDIHRILKLGGILAIITNTIDDPEKEEDKYTELEPEYYKDLKGIEKRYFSSGSIKSFTVNLFEPLLIDNKGETYKDDIKTLIRFVGTKI